MNGKTNIGNVLGTVGILGGIIYSMKNNKSFGMTSVYALAFGFGGMFIGNQIQKII